MSSAEDQFTFVRIRGDEPWAFTEISLIRHKSDLSDLGEPYLSALREARSKPPEIPDWYCGHEKVSYD